MAVTSIRVKLLVSLAFVAGCIEFPGGRDDRCSDDGLCTSGLACVADVCVDEAEACTNKCGVVGGADCGGCADTAEVCSSRNECVVPCVGFECGVNHGVTCGSCEDDTYECSANQCRKICDSRCGMVGTLDCGGCPSPTTICVATECVVANDCSLRPETPEPLGPGRISHIDVETPVTAYAPMCSGWLVLGDAANRVLVWNVFGSATPSLSFQFARTPRAIIFDTDDRSVTIAMGPSWKFVRLDLANGTSAEATFSAAPDARVELFAQNDGTTAALVIGGGTARLLVINSDPFQVMGDHMIPLAATRAVVGSNRQVLIASTSTVAVKWRLASDGSMVEEQRVDDGRTEMAISPDGAFVSFVPSRNAPAGLAAREYAVSDLENPVGEFVGTTSGWHSLRYTPDGSRFAGLAGHGDRMFVWDRFSRALVTETLQGSACGFSPCGMIDLRLAPDGRLMFALSDGVTNLIYVSDY